MVFRRNPTPEGDWKPTPEEWRVYTLGRVKMYV
jgi:hypothetical protein